MLVKKRKYSNFRINQTEVATNLLEREVEPMNDSFTVIPKQNEIKTLLKNMQKQLETLPDDANSEKFKILKDIAELLEKQIQSEDVIIFLAYLFINEYQSSQNFPKYPLSNKIYLVRKIFELTQKIKSEKIRPIIQIISELIGLEEEDKIKLVLFKTLAKCLKRYQAKETDAELERLLLDQFQNWWADVSRDTDLQKQVLKLLLLLAHNEKAKLESFLDLLLLNLKKSPVLLGTYLKFILKLGPKNMPSASLLKWSETMLALSWVSHEEIVKYHDLLIVFFMDVFGMKEVENLRADIFSYYCESCRSLNKDIKLKAARAIGLVKDIPESTLIRTLAKEVFDNYRAKQKMKKEINTSDISFSSENRDIAIDRVPGTFIHLLEEELSEIRIAAINSIRTLSRTFNKFAMESRDILLHMLHDESDNVRICAVEAAAEILKEITIGDFERDNLLFNLKENVFHLRVSIYKLLGIIKCSNESTLGLIINTLLTNVEAFPVDKPYIFQSLQSLISNNLELGKNYIEYRLEAEKRADQEPDWKSSTHIGKMILMATLLFKYPNLLQSYPYYFEKHLGFLKDTYPNFFVSPATKVNDDMETSRFFNRSTPRSNNLYQIHSIITQEILNCLNKKTEPTSSLKYLRKLQNNLSKIQTSEDMRSIQILIDTISTFFDILSELKNSFSMEMIHQKYTDEEIYHAFYSLIEIEEPYPEATNLRSLSTRLKIFFLLFSLWKLFHRGSASAVFYQKKILETAIYLQHYLKSLKIDLQIVEKLDNIIRNPGQILKGQLLSQYCEILIEDLKAYSLPEISQLTLSSSNKMRAAIISPETNLEDSYEMNSQLFVRLDIIADLFNIQEINEICFGVKSQDGKVELFKLTPNDIILENKSEKILKAKSILHLDYGYWNRPSKITIFIAKTLEDNNSNLVNLIQNHVFENTIKFTTKEKYVVLSNEVELLIKPVQ